MIHPLHFNGRSPLLPSRRLFDPAFSPLWENVGTPSASSTSVHFHSAREMPPQLELRTFSCARRDDKVSVRHRGPKLLLGMMWSAASTGPAASSDKALNARSQPTHIRILCCITLKLLLSKLSSKIGFYEHKILWASLNTTIFPTRSWLTAPRFVPREGTRNSWQVPSAS